MIDPVDPPTLDPTTEIAAAQQLVLGSLRQPTLIDTNDGRQFIAVPGPQGSYKLETVTLPNKADVIQPKVVSQNVKMQTAVSLAGYVNRFKNPDTVLFADIDSNSVLAIIDYHHASEGKDLVDARLGYHSALLKLPFSQEWKTWSAQSGQLMSHVDFATFLEENSIDIVEPKGAALLELCRSLQIKSNVDFKSTVRMGDVASIEFQKGDDVSTKDNMQLPLQIKIMIPVYFGEEQVAVTCFMRRKIKEGQLLLGYVMSRPENIRQAEFHRVVGSIYESTGETDKAGEVIEPPLTTVYGRPS